MEWLNYHHLLYFWTVAREGSVRRASELLHVTPSTLSIQIRELEQSLGVRLFRKSGRGLALTETGEEVQRYAGDIFSLGQEMLDMVRGRPVGKPLLFRVGVKDVMPKLVAYRLLEPTLCLPESVRLVCHEGDLDHLVADLAVHKLDAVLSDTPLDPGLKVRAYSHLLGESEVVLLGTRKLVEALRKGYPGSLNEAPFLLPTQNTTLRRTLDLWFQEHQIRPDIRGEFHDSAMLKIAGRAGVGVFAVPQVIQAEVRQMYDVELLGTLAGVHERFYALTIERKLKHPAVVAISLSARRKLGGRKST